MREVFIDCDPGHDDVMAILSALAHPDRLRIAGLTTAAGNNLLDRVTDNLLRVLTYLGRENLPCAAGADRPLIYHAEPQAAHGITGLDGFAFPPARMSVSSEHAVEFLYRRICACEKPAVIAAMAPLTNIALLLRSFPEVRSHIQEIVLMGGSISSGNIVARGEFNIYADPHAAEIVMESGCPITICPLEVCRDCSIEEKDIEWLKQKNGHVSRMAAGLLDFYAGYSRAHHQPLIPIFDLSTMMYLLYPEMFSGYPCSCRVVLMGRDTRGMTVIDPQEDSSLKVLVHADREAFVRHFREDITALDAMAQAESVQD